MLYQLTKPQLGTCDNVSGIVRCINRTARVYPANHNSSVPEFTLIPTHTKDMRLFLVVFSILVSTVLRTATYYLVFLFMEILNLFYNGRQK